MQSAMFPIEKLGDANYETWSIHMRSLLITNGYWKHVNGKTVVDGLEGEAKDKWEQIDQKALSYILLSCKASQLG
mgnify:CR=1 FL=1